ncbi:hypothetical protein FALBO_4616 [Fusarium albosuccineum]|uniref:Uncharacterized protein n=1 Tax=Fusarium albosuccineum TaxID=1237068 RepID=A0A8H4LIF6_9HYPO|nr:hypothetical protein FALBO_4616 [Fusarium albosuccineum]
MDSSIIQVWVDGVNSSLTPTSSDIFTPPMLDALPFDGNYDPMSGSPKRRRTADSPIYPLDPDKTPQQESTRHLSLRDAGNVELLDSAASQPVSDSSCAYGAKLGHYPPVFSLPLTAQQAPTESSSSSVPQARSSSPSK